MREPLPNDRYQDKRGQFVTVKSCAYHRVVFLRDGYPSECLYPLERFNTEFTYAGRACA
ncbi:DUF4222 domain-containing protein [Serratia nematodiphila]